MCRIRHIKDIKLHLDQGTPDSIRKLYEKSLSWIKTNASQEDVEASRHIALLLLGQRHALTMEQVSSATGVMLEHVGPIISQWLHPFVSVDQDMPSLSHATVRDFLQEEEEEEEKESSKKNPIGFGLSLQDPDSYSAERCLECLMEEQYGDTNRIARRLRSRFGLEVLQDWPQGCFYEYAAQNWVAHLTSLDEPDRDLLTLARDFLHSLNFTHWAEYVYNDTGDFHPIRSTETSLAEWSRGLESRGRMSLDLSGFYEIPYQDLHKVYSSRGDQDKILPWLPLMELGFYYFDNGRIKDMQSVRDRVSAGLSQLLGKKHPLALRARSEAAFALLVFGDLYRAHSDWISIAADQEEVLPDEDKTELYKTIFYSGLAEYHMVDDASALRTFAYVSAKVLSSKGAKSNMFLVANFWYAQVNAATGDFEQAIAGMEDVRKTREELYGPGDSFIVIAKLFLGEIYRRLHGQETSISYLRDAVKGRKRLWPITHPLVIDPLIRLALAYRDFDFEEEAWEALDELERHAQLDGEDKFYEYCQTRHLKALLLHSDGSTDEAISILQRLLIQTDAEKVIRPIQWVRTDLADILRYRGQEGDRKMAHALFDGVIVEKGSEKDEGRNGEPDPPRQLDIAEKTLRLCRSEGLKRAGSFLDGQGFEWRSESSLWLIVGMQAADTTVMKPPRGLGDKVVMRDELSGNRVPILSRRD